MGESDNVISGLKDAVFEQKSENQKLLQALKILQKKVKFQL